MFDLDRGTGNGECVEPMASMTRMKVDAPMSCQGHIAQLGNNLAYNDLPALAEFGTLRRSRDGLRSEVHRSVYVEWIEVPLTC